MVSQELHTILNWANFYDMVDFIESLGYAVYDYKETESTLKEWILELVEGKEISETEVIEYFLGTL